MHRLIGEWLKRWPLTDSDIEGVAREGAGPDGELFERGQQVIAQMEAVQAFMRRWREHFLKTMQPKFLPRHWEVDKPALRAGGNRESENPSPASPSVGLGEPE